MLVSRRLPLLAPSDTLSVGDRRAGGRRKEQLLSHGTSGSAAAKLHRVGMTLRGRCYGLRIGALGAAAAGAEPGRASLDHRYRAWSHGESDQRDVVALAAGACPLGLAQDEYPLIGRDGNLVDEPEAAVARFAPVACARS